jgi:hypothetical protein
MITPWVLGRAHACVVPAPGVSQPRHVRRAGRTEARHARSVAKKYPWFRPVATFYLVKDPFVMGDKGREGVRRLVSHSLEVTNYTTNHADLSGMSHAEVRKEIGTEQMMITDLAGVAPTTFAFPFGAPSELAWVGHGEGGGASWDYAGMFMAGRRPADSPFSEAFQPMEIPRIRSEGKIKENDCRQFCSSGLARLAGQ